MQDLQLQNCGYLKTPMLWKCELYDGLKAFEGIEMKETRFEGDIPDGLRLGKRVEYFALSNISQQSQIEIIANNFQVLRDKITLGEIDALLMINNQPVHLEIVYKFYLYNQHFGTGLNAWIGPNRKDSLIEKLNKLKNHQLPLLYQPESIAFLRRHNINVEDVQQRVLFKAQLFLPEDFELKNLNGLSDACVAGRYIHYSEFLKFKRCKIYIPNKHNWLVVPYTSVNWMTFDSAYEKVKTYINNQYSPMVWVKKPNGLISKYFVTFWE